MPGIARFVFAAALLCGSAAALRALELTPGVTREITIPPQAEPFLYRDLTFVMPPGATWALVEVTIGSPDQDVDLYLRFSEEIEQAIDGDIQADYGSTAPAGADERIFFTPASAPPLQTGRYYAALHVRSVNVPIRATIRYSIRLGGAQESFITSTFDVGDEGWTRNFPPSDIPGASLGDSDAALAIDPAGFLRIRDQSGPRREFAVAPAKFLGDLSRFSNAQLAYDLRHTGELPVFNKEVRILGAGSVFTWVDEPPPTDVWKKVIVPLTASRWTRTSGTATFDEVLRNVVRIEISMDHASGAEISDLDNIVFSGGQPGPPPGPGGPTSSNFETGLDGWARNFPASPIPGASVGSAGADLLTGLGGKNSERYLLLVDGGQRDVDWVVAPPKFITGLATLDRPWYEFWFRRIDGGFPLHGVRLRLFGNGSVYEWSGARPRDEWVRFRVPIDEANWIHAYGTKDFQAMLQSVQRLEVSMDASAGREANGLDEFHLRLQYTSPSGRALQLNPEEISVQVPRGAPGVERPLEITATGDELDWSAAIKPEDTSWLKLSRSTGATPDAVNVIFTTGGLGAAKYQADIVITPGGSLAPAKTIPVTLIVGGDPRVPVVNAGGVVHAANPQVPPSPGALGSLYGQFLFEGELQPGFDPATQRLPSEAAGTSVRFENAEGTLLARAPLVYLSAGQINFQTPYEVAGQSTVYVEVERNGETSNREPVIVAATGPGIFALPGGLASVVNQDGRVNAADARAGAGEAAVVYFSGAGAVNPAIESGRAAPASPLHVPTSGLQVRVGGVEARVLGAALSPGFAGLAQIAFEVPAGLAAGGHVATITVGGRESNGVMFWTR